MKLAIYHTTDLHGYVYPTNYVKDMELGILKIGSFIKEDEKKFDKSLKIDCGDLIQGSALTNYLSKIKCDYNPIIKGMEYIGYDAYSLGNHEFNYGLEYLNNAYSHIQDKVICANIKGLPFEVSPYKIFDLDGFKIGCIGLTTSFIPNWEQPKNIVGLEFIDPVEAYKQYEDELKEKSDFIIVCYHGGFERSLDDNMTPTEALNKENQGSELLTSFDSIGMILSGHQHRSFITKIKGRVCSQPMHNGQDFGRIILDTDTNTAEYDLIKVADLNNSIDKGLESIFTNLNEELKVYLDKRIGKIDSDMLIHDIFDARLNGHPMLNFLHDVQLDASGADFSSVSLFDTAIGFKKDITMKDVLINYPYSNVLKVLKLKGKTVKEAIEKSATYFTLNEDGSVSISENFLKPKVQNYNYDTYGGMTYEIDIRRPKYDRVVSIKKDGIEIDMDKEYTMVMSSYRASNTSVYPCYEGAEIVREINIDISELIIDYLQSRDIIHVETDCNFIVKR